MLRANPRPLRSEQSTSVPTLGFVLPECPSEGDTIKGNVFPGEGSTCHSTVSSKSSLGLSAFVYHVTQAPESSEEEHVLVGGATLRLEEVT